jgi:membrane-bound metal-dependent hydrolase YbcI (DUF457 family)
VAVRSKGTMFVCCVWLCVVLCRRRAGQSFRVVLPGVYVSNCVCDVGTSTVKPIWSFAPQKNRIRVALYQSLTVLMTVALRCKTVVSIQWRALVNTVMNPRVP